MALDIRRHMDLFDGDTFRTPIHIIGAGATGSWLALSLAKLGIKGELINVWDFDNVEEHNVPNQLYSVHNVGEPKVGALKHIIETDTFSDIKVHNKPFTNQRLSGYVFCMVDSMETRKSIWESAVKMKSAVKLYIEPRMGLDVGRVYNVNPMDMEHIKQYEDTFYSDEEAEVSACGTSQTVITTAMSVASYCARQLINHNEDPDLLDNEILIDYKYNNIITSKWGV